VYVSSKEPNPPTIGEKKGDHGVAMIVNRKEIQVTLPEKEDPYRTLKRA